MRVLPVAVLLAVVACSAAGKDEPTATVRAAIQGGSTDTGDPYAVGVCRNTSRTIGGLAAPPGHCVDYCSGALILPNVVATARHCVSNAPEEVDCTQNPTFGDMMTGPLYITTNGTMDPTPNSTGWFEVADVRVPDDAHICGSDMALLILKDPVPSSVAVPIVPGVQYAIWDPAQYTSIFVAIGFGNVSETAGDGLGVRRKRDGIPVVCVPGSNTVCAQPFSDDEFIGGDGTCAGDSGSSAFEEGTYSRGAPVSLGVLSRGGSDGNTCKGSIYTRFDTKRDFVLAVGKEASQSWTLYPEPSWTTPKPAAIPNAADAGVADASVPDASLCSDCTADAGVLKSSSDGGCSSSGRPNGSALGALLALVYLRMRSVRKRYRNGITR